VAQLAVQKALGRVAAEAADHFTELIDSGEEVPFEIATESGGSSPLYRYAPLTERFIRDNIATVRGMKSFAAAKRALGSSEAAGLWLERSGVPVPTEPAKRAEELVVTFLSRLWADSADFTIEDHRLEAALEELTAGTEPRRHAAEVVVPLVGARMPGPRLELGEVTLIRTDADELPAQARRSEGMGRSPWEPGVVAVLGGEEGEAVAERAEPAYARAVTAMRLLKAGGVALGPHAFFRGSESDWEPIATGAAQPRGGGYVLTESEGVELAELDRALAERPPEGALAWAIRRFELGTERETPLDGLSDTVLTLRALFDAGPGGVGFPTRVAAVIPEAERAVARSLIERAIELEHGLMTHPPTETDLEAAQSVAGEVEDLARGILRRAVRGELDLSGAGEAEPRGVGMAAEVAAVTAAEALEPKISNQEEPMPVAEPITADTDVIDLRWPDRVVERTRESPVVRKERTARVAEFFPRPEVTEWRIRELDDPRR
jgi:hypothetical protein